jgi:nucleotide-binding universal stress UspA family protein
LDPHSVKKILVPTDFSGPSAEAVDTAIAFAKVFGARVEILHVFVDPTYVLPPPVDVATLPFDMTEILTKVGLRSRAGIGVSG